MWPFDKKETKKVRTKSSYGMRSGDTTKEEFDTAAKQVKKINRVDDALKKFNRWDKKEKAKSENYVFEFSEKKVPAGRLIMFGDCTINMDYVTDISVSSLGSAPKCSAYSGSSMGDNHYYTTDTYGPTCATITVTYTSGKTAIVSCSRHVVEIVYAGLLKAWRN